MTTKDKVLREIEQIPEPLLGEVLDFILFLKTRKAREKLEASIISESSLKKDWLRLEENEAWQNL